MKETASKPIVLAMDSQMRCHAYGPFPTEQEAELWKTAQDNNPMTTDWTYTVIALLPGSITVRGGPRR